MIEIAPKAGAKAIRQRVEQLLRELEDRGIHEGRVDH
jgi:hypothetical protein